MGEHDLVIIGAGPAGMAAAIETGAQGIDTLVLDEQSAPGGQIWRNIERAGQNGIGRILGGSYLAGEAVVSDFRASSAHYLPRAQVWDIEPLNGAFRVLFTEAGAARSIRARHVLLATGAQERPVPFKGWTLPGVMTVGAAQILLKAARQIPDGPVWVVGSGPLPLLYMAQMIAAGGEVAGFIDTTPGGRLREVLPALLRNAAFLHGAGDLLKGLSWQQRVRRSGTMRVAGGRLIEARGGDRLREIVYSDARGRVRQAPAAHLLVHEGIVPAIHIPLALNCLLEWNESLACFQPRIDEWGELSVPGLFVAGDGAAIGGAKAALHKGRIAAIRIAQRLRGRTDEESAGRARPHFKALRQALSLQPFLQALYRPGQGLQPMSDDTTLCRCESVPAGTIRGLIEAGALDPNEVKAFTRFGMGPCQGRQCAYSLNRMLAEGHDRSPGEVGLFRIRPPLKPLSLGQLARLGTSEARHDSV